MKIKDIVDLKGCYSAKDVGDLEIKIDGDMVGALLLDKYKGGTHIAQSMGNYLASNAKKIIVFVHSATQEKI